MFRMLTVIRDRRGAPWFYQFGRYYADERGTTLRHMDSFRR